MLLCRSQIWSNVNIAPNRKFTHSPSVFLQCFVVEANPLLALTKGHPRANEPANNKTSSGSHWASCIAAKPHRERLLHRFGVNGDIRELPVFPFMGDVITGPEFAHDF